MQPSNVRCHQWLNENHGVRALTEHIWQVVGMARSCTTINELKEMVNKEFKSNGMTQLTLFEHLKHRVMCWPPGCRNPAIPQYVCTIWTYSAPMKERL